MTIITKEQTAEMCHEVNRAYCGSMGDIYQNDWDNLDEDTRESVMEGVQFHWDNPDATEAESHNRWCEVRKEQGWAFGPEKDEEAKTHPNLMPYHTLPPEQQRKDFLFKAVCNTADRMNKDAEAAREAKKKKDK